MNKYKITLDISGSKITELVEADSVSANSDDIWVRFYKINPKEHADLVYATRHDLVVSVQQVDITPLVTNEDALKIVLRNVEDPQLRDSVRDAVNRLDLSEEPPVGTVLRLTVPTSVKRGEKLPDTVIEILVHHDGGWLRVVDGYTGTWSYVCDMINTAARAEFAQWTWIRRPLHVSKPRPTGASS